MIIYFVTDATGHLQNLINAGVDAVLLSVFEIKHKNSSYIAKLNRYLVANKCRSFLDSGAFSIYSKKGKMTIDEYCDFVRHYGKMFDVVAALDVIFNPEESHTNYKYMIANNATHNNFILTWHSSSPIEYLDKCLSL